MRAKILDGSCREGNKHYCPNCDNSVGGFEGDGILVIPFRVLEAGEFKIGQEVIIDVESIHGNIVIHPIPEVKDDWGV